MKVLAAAIALVTWASAAHASYLPTVLLSTNTVRPGDTLRIELDGMSPAARVTAKFRTKTYHFYPIGPKTQRAMIGIALGSDPGRSSLEIHSAIGTPDPAFILAQDVVVATRAYVVSAITLAPQTLQLARWEHREGIRIHRAARIETSKQLWQGMFQPPVKGSETSAYGLHRIRNGTIDAGFHKGVDLEAADGETVVAPNAGIVRIAYPFRANGNTVLIDHGQGVMTICIELASIAVSPGQTVAKGDPIGKAGTNGLSTGPHVHWQVYVHAVAVDPRPWLETEF